jgi:hypothetical protein
MRKLSSLVLTTALLAAVAVTPVFADEGRGHERGERHGEGRSEWRGDIHNFHEHDYDHWRGGRWFHGFHEGHGGWWWIIDGGWYFYPAPVYPYPDPYTPPVVVAEPVPVAPMGVPPSYVYYCPNPAGYYPYVPRCYAAWERVVAATSQPVAQAPVMAPLLQAQPEPTDGQREIDDRQLNSFAVEFQNVNPNGYRARSKLKNLEARVEAFRQSLYQRQYNAMDILRDAERLEQRISAERQALPKNTSAPVAATPPSQIPGAPSSPLR